MLFPAHAKTRGDVLRVPDRAPRHDTAPQIGAQVTDAFRGRGARRAPRRAQESAQPEPGAQTRHRAGGVAGEEEGHVPDEKAPRRDFQPAPAPVDEPAPRRQGQRQERQQSPDRLVGVDVVDHEDDLLGPETPEVLCQGHDTEIPDFLTPDWQDGTPGKQRLEPSLRPRDVPRQEQDGGAHEAGPGAGPRCLLDHPSQDGGHHAASRAIQWSYQRLRLYKVQRCHEWSRAEARWARNRRSTWS